MEFTDKKSPATSQVVEPAPSIRDGVVDDREAQEVFKVTSGGVNFRTVTWPRMIIVMLKVQIATGVLGIPGALGTLGAVPGALLIVGCQVVNTCTSKGRRVPRSSPCPLLQTSNPRTDTACLLIDFRNRYPHCHSMLAPVHVGSPTR